MGTFSIDGRPSDEPQPDWMFLQMLEIDGFSSPPVRQHWQSNSGPVLPEDMSNDHVWHAGFYIVRKGLQTTPGAPGVLREFLARFGCTP